MGVKNWVKRVGEKAGNKIARMAALSPEQLQDVQDQREKYLSEMPDPNDPQAVELTERLLAASSVEIYNAYLPQLHDLYVPVQKDAEYEEVFSPAHNIRYFKITKWVTDKRENSLEKLVNVYEVLSNEECNIALIFHRGMNGTDTYLAVTNTKNAQDNQDISNYRTRILDAIRGNFPGAEWKDEAGVGIVPCLNNDKKYSVVTATNIPTEKSEKFISQTIEKLLDGIVPDKPSKEYTIILLATPIQDIEERKLRLSEFYNGLAPYAGWSTNFTYQESGSTNAMATVGVNVGASVGVQNGQNSAVTNTEGTTDSENNTETDSTGRTDTESQGSSTTDSTNRTDTTSEETSTGTSQGTTESSSSTHTEGSSESMANMEGTNESTTGTVGVSAFAGGGAGAPFVANGYVGGSASASMATTGGLSESVTKTAAKNLADAATKGTAKTLTETATKTAGKAVAESVGKAVTTSAETAVANSVGHAVARTLGKAVSRSVATTSGLFKAVNFGVNFGANFARSSSVTAVIGKNEGITQQYTNYNIKHTLELLEEQMKRYEQSTALGMWDFAAYVLSEDHNIANNVAHSYLALTQGEKSYMSHTAVNVWRGDLGDRSADAKEICGYLRQLRHPTFGLNSEITKEDPSFNVYPSVVSATTSLTGKELAYSLNFPQKSVSGLPVLECAEFGRNVVTYDSENQDGKKINLGKVFHMNHSERTSVNLSLESLKSHTFITGSTGSGKSNTIYHILNSAREEGVHFLVIEPAKGEYKNVFGGNDDVAVYGTNPLISPLLRINPFSFPSNVHVLEHLDRLVEIFNVCWPMYAAMPAVLKSAVEKAYTDCGWDLLTSTNQYDSKLFPGFEDVARNIKTIIESSEYDSENKGAYKGSLLTRFQSLTTGINALIFEADEIPDDELFEKNVIIDLSRVGSSETKALIMGMLVLKLQEFRISSELPMNSPIRHLTVLEEAHNLLRRTSVEQQTESSNILGKSVEMIANAIAEMRTYGEGFIIADQAPGLMDMSVIRNTNTKVIMRLPDQGDRDLVGKAANLNDDQIGELAKLPCGVAAVYQNEWIQPVLCKIERYDGDQSEYHFDGTANSRLMEKDRNVSESLLKCIMDKELFQKGDKEDLRELKSIIIRSGLDTLVKVDFIDYLNTEKNGLESLRTLLYDFLKAEDAIKDSEKYSNIHDWVNSVVDKLDPSVKDYSKKQVDLAMALILHEQVLRDNSYRNIYYSFTEAYRNGGGVF